MSGPAGYYVAKDGEGDLAVWRENGSHPIPIIYWFYFRHDPELWDYLVSALPHGAPEVTA